MLMLCLQGLRGPEEPMLGPFTYPDLPQEGEQFPVRVRHLLTPNEVVTDHRDKNMFKITKAQATVSMNCVARLFK